MRTRTGPAQLKKFGPTPARPAFGLARLTPLLSTYTCISSTYTLYLLEYMQLCIVTIIYAWETGRRSKYYSDTGLLQDIKCCHIARYDFANAILYFAYCLYSEQLASHSSKFVSIRVRVYCSILY